MLLALDIGNTSMTVGVFRGRRLVRRGRIETHSARPARDYALRLRKILRGQADIEAVIVSSVVPRATRDLKTALRRLALPRPLILGENLRAPIRNRYRVPSQVGQDRLVNAVAACHLYGAPAIVVDFGTAVTIDLVSARREYLGGLIVPGMEIALAALTARAALLPAIPLSPPRTFLGKDTVGSMRSGLFYGYGALCDGIVDKLRRRHAPRAQVIATGGHCRLIRPFSRSIRIFNPDLTLQGLEIIYKNSLTIFRKKLSW